MLCKNCGKDIREGVNFCPFCSTKVSDSSNQEPVNQEPVSQEPETMKKKKSPMIAGIVAIVVVVLGAIAAVFGLSSSKGYEKEIENFFAYFENKDDDAEGFLTDAYWGGTCFGNAIGGNIAKDVNISFVTCMFEIESEYGSSYGYTNADSWEEFLEESTVDYLYEEFDYVYGDDWELTYEIVDSKKLSDSKVEDLQDEWEELVENYEDYLDDFEDSDADIEDTDIETIENFIDKMSDKKIKTAYEVEVDVTIEGDDSSLDETYEFKVAKVGNEWVILEGPTAYEFIWDAE